MSAGGEAHRRPWRARKTMALSSRSQMAALKAAKGAVAAPGRPSGGPKQFLDARSLRDLLCRWYEDEARLPLRPPLQVRLDGEAPAEDEARLLLRPPLQVRRDGEAPVEDEARLPLRPPLQVRLDREAPAVRMVTSSREEAPGKSAQDDHRKKRRRLEGSKEAFPKPSRPSAGAEKSDKKEPEVEKVKGFIQEQFSVSMKDLDLQLQHLHQRVDRTQCLRKHEGISIKIVKRISRLDRHLNRAITALSSKVDRLGSRSQNKPPNGGTKSKATPSKEPASGPRESPPGATGRLDDVVFLDDNMSQNPAMQAVNPTDVRQKETSAKVVVSAAAPCSSQNLFVIDLTNEENELRKDEGAKRRNAAEASWTSNPPQPLPEASKQGPDDLSRLPPLPQPRWDPGPAKDFQGTLPPQTLTLAVACLERPKGIALRWGILEPDPRCAPVESFHLFLCQEGGVGVGGNRQGGPSAWKEIHRIQAVSLSMACSLADLPPSTQCHFAMRARDIFGREGPFCEVRSVFTV